MVYAKKPAQTHPSVVVEFDEEKWEHPIFGEFDKKLMHISIYPGNSEAAELDMKYEAAKKFAARLQVLGFPRYSAEAIMPLLGSERDLGPAHFSTTLVGGAGARQDFHMSVLFQQGVCMSIPF